MLRPNEPVVEGSPELVQPPLLHQDWHEEPGSYVATSGAKVMTSQELADHRSATVPPTPGFDRFGERVSHMTRRFVLSGSSDAYRIWKFQSAEPAIEFPVTQDGWSHAWTTFRGMDSRSA